jgi:metal-responsive CopG/Arc/MetJ family transcriptional regulator
VALQGRFAKSHQIAVRVPDDLVRKIDEEVARRRQANPGSEVSRSDVIRDVLYRSLMPPSLEVHPEPRAAGGAHLETREGVVK